MFNRCKLRRVASFLLLIVYGISCNVGGFWEHKNAYAATVDILPNAKALALSENYDLAALKGIKYNPQNPYELQFVFVRGDSEKVSDEERARLIRLFLSALTIPEEKLWVNLSPYEGDRIVDEKVASTEIGEILLAQDYLLKQLSSSLTNPNTDLGKKYWKRVNDDSFNKLWISPNKISIYDSNNTVFIDDLELNVQTEEDYQAFKINKITAQGSSTNAVRDLIVPEIKKDVNSGRNFAPLRQLINSVVLAQWFKHKFADSLYSFYFNTEKLSGLDIADAELKDKVFNEYVDAFNAGAYKIIKKEKDQQTGCLLKKEYFSGGIRSSSINEMKISKLALSEIADNNTYELSTVKMSPEQSSALSAENIQDIKQAAVLALEQEDYVGFEREFLKLHKEILATPMPSHPRMDILAATIDLLHLAPHYVATVVDNYDSSKYSSSVKTVALVAFVLSAASLPFVVHTWDRDEINDAQKQMSEVRKFDERLYEQNLTAYLQGKSYKALLQAIDMELARSGDTLSLSATRVQVDYAYSYLSNTYYNVNDLPQPLIDVRRNELEEIHGFLLEYQYRAGGYVDGDKTELYRSALAKLALQPTDMQLVRTLVLLESIQQDEGLSIDQLKEPRNLYINLRTIYEDIIAYQGDDFDKLYERYYAVKEVRDFMKAYIEYNDDELRTSASAVLLEQHRDIDAINSAALHAARLQNIPRFIKEYLKLYDIIDPTKKDENYQSIRRYALSKMVKLNRQYPNYTERAIKAWDEILLKRGEEQRARILKQREGGIDLVGISDSIKAQSSSSSITISPEYAKMIRGISFKFVGETQVLPLKAILQN